MLLKKERQTIDPRLGGKNRPLGAGYRITGEPLNSYTKRLRYWAEFNGVEIAGPFTNKTEAIVACYTHEDGGRRRKKWTAPKKPKPKVFNIGEYTHVTHVATYPCNERQPLTHVGTAQTHMAAYRYELIVALDVLRIFRIYKDGTETEMNPAAITNIVDKIRELHPRTKIWVDK
jgi:hypothetical protein